MKQTKNLLILTAVLAFIFSLALEASAQKRRTTARRSTAAARTAAATASANAAEIKASAEKVSTQIKNVTKFLYVLGGIARTIEDIDRDAKTKRLSPTALSLNQTNKNAVISSIRNLRAGLAALETEFRAKPALRLYNFQIQGISDMSGQAEDLATAGQFVESGKIFLAVVEKLSDTLVSLP